MADIHEIPYNGFRAISLFSGCGGSSLGYRWAGFRVVWASEFIEAARSVYAANFPATILDGRDIRTVQSTEILSALQLSPGELDLLDGSPPCASFSTAGKGHKLWGESKKYSDTHQRTDDLFAEYLRLVREIKPKVCVAENVPGLVRGAARGVYQEIRRELEAAGYAVSAAILDASGYGVPQIRRRLFFVGVRTDLSARFSFPLPTTRRISLREAIGDLYPGPFERPPYGHPEKAEADISRYKIAEYWRDTPVGGQHKERFNLSRCAWDRPGRTITQESGHLNAASPCHPFEPRKFTIRETRRICGFPEDFILLGTYQQQIERLGRAVPPPLMRALARQVAEVLRG